MPTVEEIIDDFCGYFYGQIESIRSIKMENGSNVTDASNYQVRFYKKVLFITAIDTLAGIRFPKQRYPQLNKNNRMRFIEFLKASNCWPEGKSVSIPFLMEFVATGKITNGALKDQILQKLESYDEEGTFDINFDDIDEKVDVLLSMATTEQEEKAILECQHYELIYRYRNYLVHEAREPGRAMEITPDKDTPYYHGYIGEDKLVLAYPLEMFAKILENIVDHLKNYLKQHKLNPYDFVEETTRW